MVAEVVTIRVRLMTITDEIITADLREIAEVALQRVHVLQCMVIYPRSHLTFLRHFRETLSTKKVQLKIYFANIILLLPPVVRLDWINQRGANF